MGTQARSTGLLRRGKPEMVKGWLGMPMMEVSDDG